MFIIVEVSLFKSPSVHRKPGDMSSILYERDVGKGLAVGTVLFGVSRVSYRVRCAHFPLSGARFEGNAPSACHHSTTRARGTVERVVACFV